MKPNEERWKGTVREEVVETDAKAGKNATDWGCVMTDLMLWIQEKQRTALCDGYVLCDRSRLNRFERARAFAETFEKLWSLAGLDVPKAGAKE